MITCECRADEWARMYFQIQTFLLLSDHTDPDLTTFVIRLSPQDSAGPVDLLRQDRPRQLMRQGQGREGELMMGHTQELSREAERTTDQESRPRPPIDRQPLEVVGELYRGPATSQPTQCYHRSEERRVGKAGRPQRQQHP